MANRSPEPGYYRDQYPASSPVPSVRNSHPDLEDYYDDNAIPPPHRLNSLYNPDRGIYEGVARSSQEFLSSNQSSRHSNDNPFERNVAAAGVAGGAAAAAGGYAAGYSAASAPPRQFYGDTAEKPWNNPQPSWAQKDATSRGLSKRTWIILGAVAAVIIIVVAVAVGVTVSKKNSNNAAASNSGSSTSSNGTVTQADPNDPSSFTKDSNLHLAFYGLAYTPKNSQLPGCGNSLQEVIKDIQIMSQMTTRLRLYGADCNQSALVLEAIKQTKVNMQVYLGIYNLPNDNGDAYNRQKALIQSALQTYGADHVGGVTVGNEFMLNYLSANGATNPNSDVGDTGAAVLISNIQDTRNMISALNLGKTIPVGNSDAGSYFNNKVLAAVDYGLSNVHPWFANQSISTASSWTTNFFQETNVAPAKAINSNIKMYIAETGWPTKSSDTGNANNGASDASVANLQKFLDDFVCSSNSNGIPYFYFETFDEPWKDAQFGGVEGWWGMFNDDKTLKSGLTLPTCTSP